MCTPLPSHLSPRYPISLQPPQPALGAEDLCPVGRATLVYRTNLRKMQHRPGKHIFWSQIRTPRALLQLLPAAPTSALPSPTPKPRPPAPPPSGSPQTGGAGHRLPPIKKRGRGVSSRPIQPSSALVGAVQGPLGKSFFSRRPVWLTNTDVGCVLNNNEINASDGSLLLDHLAPWNGESTLASLPSSRV